MDIETIEASVMKTNHLVTVEGGWKNVTFYFMPKKKGKPDTAFAREIFTVDPKEV